MNLAPGLHSYVQLSFLLQNGLLMTVPVILLQIVKLYGEFCDSSCEKS